MRKKIKEGTRRVRRRKWMEEKGLRKKIKEGTRRNRRKVREVTELEKGEEEMGKKGRARRGGGGEE